MKAKLNRRNEMGFTLVEVLAVLTIIALTTVIAVANTVSLLASYRLKAGTQQVAVALQFTRANAIANNFKFTFSGFSGTSTTLDTYQVTGGESDGGNGLDAWEDRNRNGIKDTVSFPAETLPKGVRFIYSQTISPAMPLNGSPNQSSSNLTFGALGLPSISTTAVVFLKNENADKTAVTVDTAGRVQTWLMKGSQWSAL